MNYNKKQIEESIVKWSKRMLDNDMINESELKELLGEAGFKRLFAKVRDIAKKTVTGAKKAAEAIHDLVKPNKGAKMLLTALNDLAKHKIDLGNVKIYASIDDGQKYIPVIDFKVQKQKNIILIVNPDNASATPKTMKEFREVVFRDCKMKSNEKLTDVVASITVAKINNAAEAKLDESIKIVLESKLTDYIKDNNLSKEDALKPENIKKLKKFTKQNDDKTKAAIEKAFDKIESGKDASKKTKKSSSSSFDKSEDLPAETKEEKKKREEAEVAKKKAEDAKPKYTALDNELLEVLPKKTAIGFKFSKSKAEISMDYAFTL